MNRKMRAAAANKKARERRERQRPRHEVGSALFLNESLDPLFSSRVHIDNEENTIDIIPEPSEMN
jgi:hypothetical protein